MNQRRRPKKMNRRSVKIRRRRRGRGSKQRRRPKKMSRKSTKMLRRKRR